MDEREERRDEADELGEDRPENEPTSLEDGRSTEPGKGPNDEPAEGLGTHRGW